MRPFRLLHRLPTTEGLKPPFKKPFRLLFLGADEADRIFTEALRSLDGLNVGRESVLVRAELFDTFDGFPADAFLDLAHGD